MLVSIVFLIPNQGSIFTVKSQVLFLALECIEVSYYKNYVLYSNSFSCRQAVTRLKTDHRFVATVIYKMNLLATNGYDIHLSFVSGHAGILGNE